MQGYRSELWNTMVDTMNLRRFILLRPRLVRRCSSALIAYPQAAILSAVLRVSRFDPRGPPRNNSRGHGTGPGMIQN